MKILKREIIYILFGLIFFCGGCTDKPPNDEPVLTNKPATPTIEIINITEGQTVTKRITQYKTFDQCNSSSVFKAQIQFGQSNVQEQQKELVLGINVGAEAEIPEIAKKTIEGAIEVHFSNSELRQNDHYESVELEVPAHTNQEYTIVWKEYRREGTVQYKKEGKTQNIDYSYRIGLELESVKGEELQCTGKSSESPQKPVATNTSPPTTRPTATSKPTNTPVPTTIPNTSNGATLNIGETWYQDGKSLLLNDHTTFSGDGGTLRLYFVFTNHTGNEIAFEISESDFLAEDNLDRRHTKVYYSWSDKMTVESGKSINLSVNFYKFDYTNSSLDEVIITLSISSIKNAKWRIPIHH